MNWDINWPETAIWKKARDEGFKAGIEAAAALCEQFETDGGTHLGTMLQTEVTPRIRALKDSGGATRSGDWLMRRALRKL